MKLREKSLSEESKEMFDRLPTKFMERLIVLLHDNDNFREYMMEQVNQFVHSDQDGNRFLDPHFSETRQQILYF